MFTRDGWIWVNPYVTLISAYERLLRGTAARSGRKSAAGRVAHALPEDVVPRQHDGRWRQLIAIYDAAAPTAFGRAGGVQR